MTHHDNLDGIRRAIAALEQAIKSGRRDPEHTGPYGDNNHPVPGWANTDAVTSPTINESASEGSCPQRVKGPQTKGVM